MLTEVLDESRKLSAARRLLITLVRRELSARHAGSALGVMWMYLQPLALLAAYFFLFDYVLGVRLGADSPTTRMGYYLVVGMIPWMAFSDAIGRGAGALVDAGGLLQKNALPLGLFPAKQALASGVVFVPIFALLLGALLILHGPVMALLAVPVLLLLQAVLSFVLAYWLALMVAAMRDVQQIVTFALSIGLFCSPVLYPPSALPELFRMMLWLNPATPFVLAWQQLVINGAMPPPLLWWVMLGWCGVVALLLAISLARTREQVVDWL